jgi:hypothetical protein
MLRFCIFVLQFIQMKNIFSALVAISILVVSCNTSGNSVKIFHGEKFDTTGVITTAQLLDSLSKISSIQDVKVSGTIDKSCTHSGCWLTLKNEKGTEILVTYKDESFTTAKDIAGRQLVVLGNVAQDTTEGGYQFVASGLILN